MSEVLLSIGTAAAMLGVSRDTLRRWEERGYLIPVRTAKGHRRYREADLRQLKATWVDGKLRPQPDEGKQRLKELLAFLEEQIRLLRKQLS